MRNKAGMKFDCIFEEPLDFIDIDYTHLNKTIRYEQRPHGEWKYDAGSGQFICSECEGGVNMPTLMGEPLYKWCPWCGSDNRKRGEAE